MDHDQLVEEMGQIERLTTAERLRLARKRRGQQLKKWNQRDREYNLRKKNGGEEVENQTKIHFVPAVMLLEAAARNDVEEVRRLLELDVSPDSTNEDGLTALHQCCIDDSEEMMKVLVEFGANVNAADSEQWTPLHAASTCGHLHLVKFLIEKGANLLAVNGDGNMPYDICEDETTLSFIENEMAKRGVTQELIDTTRAETETLMLADLSELAADRGDLEFRDKYGATPLHIASANGYLQVLEFLLDNHVSTEVIDLDHWQPLHAAACWGHLEAVEILAQNGADISALTKAGETPFDITEDPDIKDRLVELAEQRLRLSEPRVRRGRSSSTRTHSIRRTSLRDKMKTTKKDVAEEGLIYKQSVSGQQQQQAAGVTATAADDPLSEQNGRLQYSDLSAGAVAAAAINQDVVDVADVQICLPSPTAYTPTITTTSGSSNINNNSINNNNNNNNSLNKPVQYVSPTLKSSGFPPAATTATATALAGKNTGQSPMRPPKSAADSPPVRPARRQSSGLDDQQQPPPHLMSSTSLVSAPSSTSTPPLPLWSSSNGGASEPINIHVSVTINPGIVPGQTFPSPPGTLADLKRTRSQNRASGSCTSSTVSLSSHSGDREGGHGGQGNVMMNPKHGTGTGSSSGGGGGGVGRAGGIGAPPTSHSQPPSSLSSPSATRKKFAASSGELVGPPAKTGCCQIF